MFSTNKFLPVTESINPPLKSNVIIFTSSALSVVTVFINSSDESVSTINNLLIIYK